jgi:serine O-acetyltransferase
MNRESDDLVAHLRELVASHKRDTPPFLRAVRADAIVFSAYRNERKDFTNRFSEALNILRLCWKSEDFLGLVLYRLAARMRVWGLPILPGILDKCCAIGFNIRIGAPVLLREGVYIPHGNTVIDGLTEIGKGCRISPFTTIGLLENDFRGPIIGKDVQIGTGSRVLGPLHIGDRAVIGAGAVVVRDVPADTTVVGVPARPVAQKVPL